MSNCSNHRKDILGQTDMKHLAEDIGNLHYECLANLLYHLDSKLKRDAALDLIAGRKKISLSLINAAHKISLACLCMREAWKISEPFMEAEMLNVQPIEKPLNK